MIFNLLVLLASFCTCDSADDGSALDLVIDSLIRHGRSHELSRLSQSGPLLATTIQRMVIQQVKLYCPNRISGYFLYHNSHVGYLEFSAKQSTRMIKLTNDTNCLQALVTVCEFLPYEQERLYPVYYEEEHERYIKRFVSKCPTMLAENDGILTPSQRFIFSDIIRNNLVGLTLSRNIAEYSESNLNFPKVNYLRIQARSLDDVKIFPTALNLAALEIRYSNCKTGIQFRSLLPHLKHLIVDTKQLHRCWNLFPLPLPSSLSSIKVLYGSLLAHDKKLSKFFKSLKSITDFSIDASAVDGKGMNVFPLTIPSNVMSLRIEDVPQTTLESMLLDIRSLKKLTSLSITKMCSADFHTTVFQMIGPNVRTLSLISLTSSSNNTYNAAPLKNTNLQTIIIHLTNFMLPMILSFLQSLPKSCTKLDLSTAYLKLIPFFRTLDYKLPDNFALENLANRIRGGNCESYEFFFQMISSMKSLKTLSLKFYMNRFHCESVWSILSKHLPKSVKYVNLGLGRNEIDSIKRNQSISGLTYEEAVLPFE